MRIEENDLKSNQIFFDQKRHRTDQLAKLISTDLFWILIISGIARLIYYSALLNTQTVDSATYLNYHANLLKGETMAFRTPLYPYFIKLIGLSGGQNLINNVVKAQIAISFYRSSRFIR